MYAKLATCEKAMMRMDSRAPSLVPDENSSVRITRLKGPPPMPRKAQSAPVTAPMTALGTAPETLSVRMRERLSV